MALKGSSQLILTSSAVRDNGFASHDELEQISISVGAAGILALFAKEASFAGTSTLAIDLECPFQS